MADSNERTFFVEISSTRKLEASDLQRILARLPGVESVSVSDPYGEPPDSRADDAQTPPDNYVPDADER